MHFGGLQIQRFWNNIVYGLAMDWNRCVRKLGNLVGNVSLAVYEINKGSIVLDFGVLRLYFRVC